MKRCVLILGLFYAAVACAGPIFDPYLGTLVKDQSATSSETDPVYSASAAAGVTTEKAGNWDAAYGWGDHALAGYADAGHDHDSDYVSVVAAPTAGNLASLTAGGEVQDSGSKAADFAAASHTHTRTQTITVTFDGGGAEIADNAKWYYQVPVACTLTGWTILADQAGAIKIDVWSQAYADFPPEDAQSICNGHEPEIAASAAMATDADIADWSGEALSAGATLIFNVDSCTTIQRAVLILKVSVTE